VIVRKDSTISLLNEVVMMERKNSEYFEQAAEEREKEYKKEKRKLVLGLIGTGTLSIGLLIVAIL